MSGFSGNTTVSIYKFDSFQEYQDWYKKYKKKVSFIAVVKDDNSAKGFDLYINGYSISKTNFFIEDEKGNWNLLDSDGILDGQYTVVKVDRKGNGGTRQVYLQKLFIDIDSYDSSISKIIFDKLKDSSSDIAKKIQDMIDSANKGGGNTGTTDPDESLFNKDYAGYLNRILTNTHFMFRKIYWLMKDSVETPELKISFLDNEGKEYNDGYSAYLDQSFTLNKVRIKLTAENSTFESLSAKDFNFNYIKVTDQDGNIYIDKNISTFGIDDNTLDLKINPINIQKSTVLTASITYKYPDPNTLIDDTGLRTLSTEIPSDITTRTLDYSIKFILNQRPADNNVYFYFWEVNPSEKVNESIDAFINNENNTVNSLKQQVRFTEIEMQQDGWMYFAYPSSSLEPFIQYSGLVNSLTKIVTSDINNISYTLYRTDYPVELATKQKEKIIIL